MTKNRRLSGVGDIAYNYQYDVLTYTTKDRNYSHSLEFGNFVADIDEEDFVTGVRIMDASKVLGLTKVALKRIRKARFQAQKEAAKIAITLDIVVELRNKRFETPMLQEKSTLIQESAPLSMRNGFVEASVEA